MADFNINDLSDGDLQRLADRLIPIINRKLTLRSQDTILGKRGETFNKMKVIELTTTGQKQSVENPLKEVPDGCLLLEPAPDAKLKMVTKTKHKITFNSDEAGHTIRLYIF